MVNQMKPNTAIQDETITAVRASLPIIFQKSFGENSFVPKKQELFEATQSENLHPAKDCFFRSHVSVMYCDVLRKTDTVQNFTEFSGDGDAGNGSDGVAVVVVRKTNFTANVIVVGVYLKTGHG